MKGNTFTRSRQSMKNLSIQLKLLILICFCFPITHVTKVSAKSSGSEDSKTCSQWIKVNLVGKTSGISYPFSFIYNGKPSSEFLSGWKTSRMTKILDQNRRQTILELTDPKTNLEVRCEIIQYNDFPAVEWTVYFKNKGTSDSPILEDIQALNTNLIRETGSDPKKEFCLNYLRGGGSGPADFEPLQARLDPDSSKTVGSFWGGFPTAENLPFFNIKWKNKIQNQGVIVAAGWPARWKAQFKRDNGRGLSIFVGQMHTHLLLHPGEEIRTPLVALLFWSGDQSNSQNTWRRWMIVHNVPRQEGKLPGSMLEAASSSSFAEMYNADELNQKIFIGRYLEEKIPLDYWWMDAGWYPNKGHDWQDLLGTWEADPKRFPNGLKAVSDFAHANGVKTILWFEPERVIKGSWLFTNHPEWLLGDGDSRFFNHGNREASQWLTNHVDSILTNEHIDLYRQDFAVFSDGFWNKEDSDHPDRQGITENKHVVGYLRFFDELRRRHPGMLIDICAAGGKRLELENLRRAVPLWRSDYAQEPVGVQSQSYGLASWLPYSGTGVANISTYDFRSEMCSSTVLNLDPRKLDANYDLLRKLISQWRNIAPDYYGDYYPLTPYSLEKNAWIGWEYYRPETGTGFVQVFRRAEASETEKIVYLKGLNPDSEYTLTDFDDNQSTRIKGKDLLSKGMKLTLPEKSQAKLIRIEKIH